MSQCDSIPVLSVVNAVLSNQRIFKKRRRIRYTRVRGRTVKEKIATGIAIHQHVDPYKRVPVAVYSEQDVRALKLLNLIVKLEDLSQHGSVQELELKVPWSSMVDKVEAVGGCASNNDLIILVGVWDAVYMIDKKLTVEELKTHDIVTGDGRPVVEMQTMASYKHQVLLYSLMMQKFLNGITSGCPYLRRAYVGQETLFTTVSGHVQKLMLPLTTLNELYDSVRNLVKNKFKQTRVMSAKVTHVSQSLVKRAISLNSDEVIAYEESHRLRWTFLKQQLARVDPCKIASSNTRRS